MSSKQRTNNFTFVVTKVVTMVVNNQLSIFLLQLSISLYLFPSSTLRLLGNTTNSTQSINRSMSTTGPWSTLELREVWWSYVCDLKVYKMMLKKEKQEKATAVVSDCSICPVSRLPTRTLRCTICFLQDQEFSNTVSPQPPQPDAHTSARAC